MFMIIKGLRGSLVPGVRCRENGFGCSGIWSHDQGNGRFRIQDSRWNHEKPYAGISPEVVDNNGAGTPNWPSPAAASGGRIIFVKANEHELLPPCGSSPASSEVIHEE